jgi:hypothetical protein
MARVCGACRTDSSAMRVSTDGSYGSKNSYPGLIEGANKPAVPLTFEVVETYQVPLDGENGYCSCSKKDVQNQQRSP